MDFEKKLKQLTKNEMTVLFYKSQGLKYAQIKGVLGYSLEWVQLQMSSVYTKLEFDKSIHWTKRKDILENEIYPLVLKLIGDDPKNLEKWKPEVEIKALQAGNIGQIKEEPVSDPETMALVILDEKMMMEGESRGLQSTTKVIDYPPNIKRGRSCLVIAMAFIVLVAVGYGAYILGSRSAPQVPPQVQVVTATFPPNPIDAPIQVFTNTPASTSTFTPEPTSSPIPTATEFIPPVNGILFQDNFDDGLSPEWNTYGGQWLVSNGALTILPDDVDAYAWISLRKPEWKNYTVSLTINIPFQNSAAQSSVAVAVRNNGSQPKYLGVPVETILNRVYWAFIEGYTDTPIAGQNNGFAFTSGSTMELEVSNNDYALRVNGREIQKISMSGYDSGGISLGIYCYQDLGCPSFDNVKVTYLP